MDTETVKLINLIKNRDQKGLVTIMDLYLGSVYSVAKNILTDICSVEDIEECVQDVFIDSWNKIEQYDLERGTLKTWILILCKYKALNLRKKVINKGKVINIDDIQYATKESIDDVILAKESRSEILEVINTLNPIDRNIFIRRYFLNQDIYSICNSLKMTRKAVDNRLCRGRKKIKEILDYAERRTLNE